MDATKFKKLEESAALLARAAENFERDGEKALAIEKYLKAVDVLLVMADVTVSYPTWLLLTNKADFYQKKVKKLIASSSIYSESMMPALKEIQPRSQIPQPNAP